MKFKRIITYLLVLTIAFSLVGCSDIMDNTSPAKTVKGFLTSLKEYNKEDMSFFLSQFPDSADCGVTYDLFSDSSYVELYKTTYKKLSYKINSIKESDRTATIVVTVTHPDLKTAYSSALTMATAQIFGDNDLYNTVMSDPEADISYLVPQQMKSIYEAGQVEEIRTSYTLTLIKKNDDTWAIKADDTLKNLMSANVFEITSTIATGTTDE